MKRVIAAVAIVVLLGVLLAGYRPQRRQVVRLETEVSTLRDRVTNLEARSRAAALLGDLLNLNAVDPLLVEAAKIRRGIDLPGAEVEPALRTFVDGACISGTPSRVETVLQVQTGQPADVILETASAVAADLIVMGTHGLGGVRKWVLGSTTEHVLRRTGTPVLAIPAGPEELLIHVVEPISVPPWWRADMSDADEQRIESARANLQQLAGHFSAFASFETIVTLGRSVDSIATVAEHRQAGLIVMGVAGGGQWFGARPGSIAYGVLSLATAPVLVVPPQRSAPASYREAS